MPNHQNRSALSITPAHFKTSFLSIPPSPFSPRTPLTPAPLPAKFQRSIQPVGTYPQPVTEVPSKPLSWIWSCHQCYHSYHLGTTRRCLIDGHHFCSGATSVKLWRKSSGTRRIKKHRACESEFDYQGWKTWGRWKRGGPRLCPDYAYNPGSANRIEHLSTQGPDKDCWNTSDYPSQCRWGKKFVIHTPVDNLLPSGVSQHTPIFEGPDDTNIARRLNVESYPGAIEDSEMPNLWDALTASIERKKGDQVSSPLAVVAGD